MPFRQRGRELRRLRGPWRWANLGGLAAGAEAGLEIKVRQLSLCAWQVQLETLRFAWLSNDLR